VLSKASRFPFRSLPFPSFPIAVFDHPHRLTYDHIKTKEPATMNTLPIFRTELRAIHSAPPSAISPGNDRYEPLPLGSHFWCCLVLFGAVWCSLVLKFIFAKTMAEAPSSNFPSFPNPPSIYSLICLTPLLSSPMLLSMMTAKLESASPRRTEVQRSGPAQSAVVLAPKHPFSNHFKVIQTDSNQKNVKLPYSDSCLFVSIRGSARI
jgi:hypothetical protein